jgi:hypothetical protein
MITPEKSRPGVRGSVVCSKSPATFLGSLGFMAAALTSTSSSPEAGVVVDTSSISSTDGGPKWWNLKALNCTPVRTTLHSKDRRLSLKAISSRVRELSGTAECGTNVPAALMTLAEARANRYADTAALFQALGDGWWNRSDIPKK